MFTSAEGGINVKIRTKILGLTIAPVLGIMLMLIIGFQGKSSMDHATQDLVNNNFRVVLDEKVPALESKYQAIALMLNADRDGYQALEAEYIALLAKDDAAYTDAIDSSNGNLKQVKERLQKASRSIHPDARPTYEKAMAAYDAWYKQTTQAMAKAKDPANRAALIETVDERTAAFGVMRDLIDQLQIDTEERIAESEQMLEESRNEAYATAEKVGDKAQSSAITFLIISVSFAAAIIGLCLFIARSITNPMNKIITHLTDIAQGEGDLTKRIDADRKDEIGEIGKLVNKFIEKVHDVVLSVDRAAVNVASAANEISTTAKEMTVTTNNQTRQVQEINAAVEEMSSNVLRTAQQAADAADSADQSGKTAQQGGEVVGQTIDGMHSISESVSASSAAVSQLGRRGEQIGEVIVVINEIADQTNLLALNAAIEAARAGEHGRGFAVVADEVRKLADRTTKATQEVSESIQLIQQETADAVDRMNAGTEQVSTGVDQATRAGQSLNEIVTGSQHVAKMIREIAALTERQSETSEQIGTGIQQIAAASSEAADGANQSATAVSKLSSKAEELQALVSQFKLDRSRG